MTSAPGGWTLRTLGDLGRYLNGRAFKKSEWGKAGRPIIRIQNLTGSGNEFNYFLGHVEERYVARPGDLLVSWAATLGAFIWSGPEALVNQHIFKVESNIDVRFHKYLLDFKLEELMRHTHGSGMVHITRGRFDAVPVFVPPLDEQRRIVDLLEDHLSRLEAALAGLEAVKRRVTSLEQAVLAACYQGGELQELGSLAAIQGGLQKQPKRAPAANAFPFLRVANVTSHGLDLADVHRVELFDGELERLRLQPGDLLVVEGNGSASQIGRAALWNGSVENCVHQNHLIRVRPSTALSSDYLEAIWNSPQNRRQLTDLASSSSGLHTLSVGKLKALKIPVASADAQLAVVARVQEIRAAGSRLHEDVAVARARGSQLRRSVLAAAFSGDLTRGSHTLEGSDV